MRLFVFVCTCVCEQEGGRGEATERAYRPYVCVFRVIICAFLRVIMFVRTCVRVDGRAYARACEYLTL